MKKKEKKTKKEITLDDLALMVGKGFNEMGERFERVDGRLANLEKGQAALEKGQEEIKTISAGGCIFLITKNWNFGLKDSKKKSASQREKSRTNL